MPTALIKFTQGPNTDVPGNAVIGTVFAVDGTVTVTNGDNTDVASWQIVLLDAPPDSVSYPDGSVPQELASAVSGTPSATFNPDVSGSYRVLLDVVNGSGSRDRDIRVFSIPDPHGVIVPPFQRNPDPLPLTALGLITPIASPAAKPQEQNYGGQERGYAGTIQDMQLDGFLRTSRDYVSLTVNSTPFTVLKTHPTLLLVNTSVARTLTLPTDAREGQRFIIKDVTGNAATANITVNPGVGDTIDGGSSWTLALNYAAVEFRFDGTLDWSVL